MKNGTFYAERLKKAYANAKRAGPRVVVPEPDDPIRRLAIAILGVECGDDVASRALDRAFTTLLDWNEVRVSSEVELNRVTGNTIPNGVRRFRQLTRALQAVFDAENAMSLDRLKSMTRREARQYLDTLDGVDEYAAASVILWTLGGHAIPVSDPLLEALRRNELVHPTATRAEVQAFVERNISAAEAKAFCLVMKTFKGHVAGGARRSQKKTATRTRRVGAKRAAK